MRARLLRRSAPLLQRPNFFARLVIRFRIWRSFSGTLRDEHRHGRSTPHATDSRIHKAAHSSFSNSDTPRLNQPLQLTVGRRDEQLRFFKHIIDDTKARVRQR
jgi:hypothetical protein